MPGPGFRSIPILLWIWGQTKGMTTVTFYFQSLNGAISQVIKQVWLDTTPPVIVVTKPALVASGNTSVATVSVPVIQVLGFCPERLWSISFDLLNAAGLVTNQQVFVLDQYYDMSIGAFTTNTFQAFDVPLTNGLNTFTIHATDLAGNVGVTNFGVILDYSGKTTPQVQVNWPTNGMIVCGSNFVCCGLVDDPTATIVVEIVDSFGDTNSVTAAVGRGGDFYAQNLPLSSGSNYLTLHIADAAGHGTNMSLTLAQGDFGLTIGPVVAGQTTVTGGIGPGDFTICVNGVEATNNGYGTWTAEIAPIGATGGTVEAVAASSSGETQSALLLVPAPSGVFISSYQEQDQERINYNDAWQTWTNELFWSNGQPGWQGTLEAWGISRSYSWPATSWPQQPTNGLMTEINPTYHTTNTSEADPPALLKEHWNVNFTNVSRSKQYLTQTADTRLALATGGPPGSTKRLWVISASATSCYVSWNDNYSWWSEVTSSNSVNPHCMAMMGMQLDTNGNRYLVLPDNTIVRCDAVHLCIWLRYVHLRRDGDKRAGHNNRGGCQCHTTADQLPAHRD